MRKKTGICPFLIVKLTLKLASLHLTKCTQIEVSEENRNRLRAGMGYRTVITYEFVNFSFLMWNCFLCVVPSSHLTPQII